MTHTHLMSIVQLLEQLYPGEAQHILDSLQPELNESTFNQHIPRDWHSHLQFYVTYPDAFSRTLDPGNIETLTQQLSRIKSIGCNAIHLLPFYPSPKFDGGFDVSDYFSVRPELGDSDSLKMFISTAKEHGIHLFFDLPLNHVSHEHAWYQSATSGDQYYQEFFIHSPVKPELLNYEQTPWGNFAHYQVFGNQVKIPIIFPKQEGELPGWVSDANQHWYFHTFYPHQIDLNWNNPAVFLEISRVIIYWVKQGVSLRIDAAPHLDKQFVGEITRSTPRNHLLIQALRQISNLANPFSLFLVEVVDSLEAVKSYLHGSPQPEAEMAYNFQILNGLWAALTLHQTSPLWDALQRTQDIPAQTQWLNFLRNHDALMLGFLESDIPNQVFNLLKDKGQPFDGIQVAGRTASLLDNQPEQIVIAHLLLASLPGNPAIFYGDELGKTNDHNYLDQQTQTKIRNLGRSIEADARELGRGYVSESLLKSHTAQQIQEQLSSIFNIRLKHHQLHTQSPEQLSAPEGIFAARYILDFNQSLDIYINLNPDTEHQIELNYPRTSILNINHAHAHQTKLTLPPLSGIWLK